MCVFKYAFLGFQIYSELHMYQNFDGNIYVFVFHFNIYICLSNICFNKCVHMYQELYHLRWYGVATVSGIDKITGLFCKRDL